MNTPFQLPGSYPDQNTDIEEVEIDKVDERDHVDTGNEVPDDEIDKC